VSFMKLSPESVRLRRLAKAHAAGELGTAEYRASRREVIDNFAAGVSSSPAGDDDTRPRWPDDITLRGGHGAVEMVASEPASADAGGAGRRLLWVVTVLLACVALLLALPRAMAASEVPPVRERSADPAASPRLPVVEVAVRAASGERLPSRLSLARLQERADAALAAVRARHTAAAHGFTASELDELARLLNALGVHEADSTLDAADARDISALVRDQKVRRGISVMELEEVARAVQNDAREQGYFLAAAYVPAQRVDAGVVQIEVMPGRLGDVVVEGSDSGAVSAVFGALLGEPVTLSEVSSRLQTLDRLAGVNAQASFGPGELPGESRLRLTVQQERRWQGALVVDNFGDDATGKHRLGGSVSWLDPRGVGDRLSAGAMVAFDPANQTYAYLGYDLPVGGDYRLATRIGNHDFSRDGVPDLDGSGLFVDVAARRSLGLRREQTATVVWSAAYQGLDWDSGIDQTVALAGMGLAAQRVWDSPRIAADAAVNFSVGRLAGDRFVGQQRTPWLFEVDIEGWMPVRVPGLTGEQKLVGRLAGQWGSDGLPATRRFALGGAQRARGYERDEFLADRALLLGVEGHHPLAVGELLVFAEFAYGNRRDAVRDWARVADAGIGWQALLPGGLSTRLTVAWPFAADGSGDIDDDGAKAFWSLRYDH
jgi:hypothetical protein